MARIRSIHPGIFTDEAYMALSLAARELIKGLWIESDDQGVFQWKPLTLKARIFPADNIDVSAILSELEAGNFIRSYERDGQQLGAVRNFRKFQHPKFPNATYFLPDELRNYVGLSPPITEMDGVEPSSLPQPYPKVAPDGEERREEDKKGDSPPVGPPQPKRGSRLADDWQPDEKACDFARSLGLDPGGEAEKFRDHWHAAAGRTATKLDWRAAWRTWCRRSREFSGVSGGVRGVDRVEQSAARVRSKAVALARSTGGFGSPLQPPENPSNAGADRDEDRGPAGALLDAEPERGCASGDDRGLDSGAGGSAFVGLGRGVHAVADGQGNGTAETFAGGHSGSPAESDVGLEIPAFLRRGPQRGMR